MEDEEEMFQAPIQVMGSLEEWFPEKVPKGTQWKCMKKKGKRIVEAIGNFKIDKNEEFMKKIWINGEKINYKIILIKGDISKEIENSKKPIEEQAINQLKEILKEKAKGELKEEKSFFNRIFGFLWR